MQLSLISAMAKNRVIGLNNQMPWHLPAELAWFKKNTSHKPIIMGRKTFESIGRPLPNRHNIVISRQASSSEAQKNVTWTQSLEEAIKIAQADNAEEVFIIGGGTIYQQALEQADKLYLTHIDLETKGDTHFPDYTVYSWQTLFAESHIPDQKNPYGYRVEILERLSSE